MPKPYYEDTAAGITIWHGDALELLPSLRGDIVITDPPFGVGLRRHGQHKKRGTTDWTVAGDDDQSVGHAVLSFCRAAGLPLVVFASPKKPWAGAWRQYLVWDKGPAVGAGGDMKTCWKFDWELIQIHGTGILNGQRDSSVLRYWVGPQDFQLHPCQKPVALLSYLIGKTTQPGAMILDPFLGSGSTLEAARLLGRRAVGIEKEERYCEIAAKRLEQAVMPLAVPVAPASVQLDMLAAVSE